MKHITAAILLSLLFSAAAMAGSPMPPAQPDLGKWWKNSRVVHHLQLNDNQIRQIEQAFLGHRSELNSLRLELERREAALQTIIAANQLDDKKAAAQIEQVVAARGMLEKENALMMLEFRRAVSVDQWNKLQGLQQGETNAAAPATPANQPGPKTESGPSSAGEPIYSIGGPVSGPVPIQSPLPAYTQEAGKKHIEGSVLLEVVIGKDGVARNVKVLRGLGYGLDESAVDAVTKHWVFKPGMINGQPVSVSANIEVSFRLY
ncbi:MAG: TonB family protein [Acidobacteriota bacterium]|jgi:TonB family protein